MSLVMAGSPSSVSSGVNRHGCGGGGMEVGVKGRLLGSLAPCVPHVNRSGWLGGAGRADIIGGGVLSLKPSNT